MVSKNQIFIKSFLVIIVLRTFLKMILMVEELFGVFKCTTKG